MRNLLRNVNVCARYLCRDFPPESFFFLEGHADEMCRCVFGYCAVLVHNIIRSLSGVNGEIFWPGRSSIANVA